MNRDEAIRIITPFVDENFYAAKYPWFQDSCGDAALHYYEIGWKLNCNPNLHFNTNFYLQRHPDIKASGMNPLLHYIQVGRVEGRLSERPHERARSRLEEATEVRTRAKHWAGAALEPGSFNHASLTQELAKNSLNRLIISVSHDDYALPYGGVQSVIGDEACAAQKRAWTYLHLSPAKPLPCLAEMDIDIHEFDFHIRLNGQSIGVTNAFDLMEVLQEFLPSEMATALVIHHLMGHSPEIIAMLAKAIGVSDVWFWVHDFFSICPSYALMRNDVSFCNAPPFTSAGCTICCYGEERRSQTPRIKALFEKLNPNVIAPSSSALTLWQRRADFSHQSRIAHPLAKLVLAASDGVPHGDGTKTKIRIAHLGGCVFFKGWPVFERLAERFADDPRYEFVQLGHPDASQTPKGITNVPTVVTRQDRDAMINAVAEHDIDVVICWPLWPETFSFTVHEAMCGGAFVVTRQVAGNIASVIQQQGANAGVVLTHEAELTELLQTSRLAELLKSRTRRRGLLLLGSGIIEHLDDDQLASEK